MINEEQDNLPLPLTLSQTDTSVHDWYSEDQNEVEEIKTAVSLLSDSGFVQNSIGIGHRYILQLNFSYLT